MQRTVEQAIADHEDTLPMTYMGETMYYSESQSPSPVRAMASLDDVADETGLEEEEEEEDRTTDEEVELIAIHDGCPIEIEDEDDSVLSPQKPQSKLAKGPEDAEFAAKDAALAKEEVSLPAPSEGVTDVQVAEEVQDILDSEDEGSKENSLAKKGTFQVGVMRDVKLFCAKLRRVASLKQ